MLKWNTSSILLCGWLALVVPAPSVHCCNSATNDTDKVSFTLCIVDSLKKNFPNIVLVKQDCSTARMQTIMHTFLQWRKQACDVNFNPQTVLLLYHHLNFFFFQERCDNEFHFGCISQLCPLGNWEHNSQLLWIIQTEDIFGLFTKMSGFSANQIVLSGKTRQFVNIPFACMWMSHFSANRIAFGGKMPQLHSTQLLVDESINATVRLGGGRFEGEAFVDYFLNVGFPREPNCT